jgi:hypothetical protein
MTGKPILHGVPGAPENPLDALLHGQHLPGLPTPDRLLGPFHSLLSGFGTGVDGLDAGWVFKEGSKAVDAAMTTATGALEAVDYGWNSIAAMEAKHSGRKALASGDQLSRQGMGLSGSTTTAADAVRRGNAKVAAIMKDFAAQVARAGPLSTTLPGQVMVLESLADHLSRALAAVNETSAELSAHAANVSDVGMPVDVPPPPEIDPVKVAGLAIGVVQPVFDGVTGFAEDVVDLIDKNIADHMQAKRPNQPM